MMECCQKMTGIRFTLLIMIFNCLLPVGYSQARRNASAAPKIDVEDYAVQVTLDPASHELNAVATITFRAIEETDIVLFEISENLWVRRVLNSEGVELEFEQDEIGPGTLSVRFTRPLPVATSVSIQVEYGGGFERDRFSRLYTRDESNAYIGMDGSYLLYSSKWFPISRFIADRSKATIDVTVPLGMSAIGPGTPSPVVTKGITETFRWTADHPILPNSIVVGRYFTRSVTVGEFTIDCVAKEEHLEAVVKSAETLGKILEYYSNNFGPSAAGKSVRLVEVDDRVGNHSGMLGTVFITPREFNQPSPPVRQLARRAAFQWWQETVGVRSTDDLWLIDGMAYDSAAMYLGQTGAEALKEETDNLAVLALKSESKSAVRGGFGLGYKSEAYESVVGGKGSWVLRMLNEIIGETAFNQLMRDYLVQFVNEGASTADFQKLAEKIYGKELGWFFAEWVDTIGVPTLESDYVVLRAGTGFRVTGSIKQDNDLFRMPVEVEIVTTDGSESKTVELSGKSTPFEVNTFALPQKVVLDPHSKILRDSPQLQFSVRLSMGDDLRQNGELVEAIRAYEDALKVNPHKSIAHFRLAETFYDQFNLQSAANSFRDALNGDRDPKWIEVWCYIYLGKIYDILGQRQRALAEYNKAINTKDDTNGAQEEAKKWISAPFTRDRTTMGNRQPD